MNSKPSFIISRPDGWIKKGTPKFNLNDFVRFCENIHLVLTKLEIEHNFTSSIKKRIQTDGIHLSHHTTFDEHNIWNMKKGYLPNYIYFDKTGYSGWAEMANNEQLFKDAMAMDQQLATKFFDEFAESYIASNNSKIRQPSVPFVEKSPYVFVGGQVPADSVMELADLATNEMAESVAAAYQHTNYKVVYKPHPLRRQADFCKKLQTKYGVLVTHASIHDIIPNCSAVYVVNSGVGFESLLHLKPVFTSGHSDYHWATTRVRTHQNIIDSIGNFKVDCVKIKKFVFYMLTEYFCNCDDLEQIERKIMQCITHYHKNQEL